MSDRCSKIICFLPQHHELTNLAVCLFKDFLRYSQQNNKFHIHYSFCSFIVVSTNWFPINYTLQLVSVKFIKIFILNYCRNTKRLCSVISFFRLFSNDIEWFHSKIIVFKFNLNLN